MSSPVVAGCAHCGEQSGTSRREFIAASAASAVAALLVTACGGGTDTTGVNTGPLSLSVQVSSYPALANVGGMAQVNNGGTPVAAVRTGASSFAAFSLICPHSGCTVGITGSSFYCPCHGARFASTGAWTGGQRTSNLASLTTSYDATTGVLTITS
ncbi:MAG TPA: Rieske (2Fe-2S) protein [Gemmatimonadaceae bacterium]|nr:Rieske (2Fe-2S) protein [Gemmatimonadaceae bacterium]